MAMMFFSSARDKFRLDPTEIQQVASLHLPVPALFLVLTGVFEGSAAVALALGVYARVAAGALAVFTFFVSLVFVKFWSFEGPLEMRSMLKIIFFGDVAVSGGLVYIAVLGPGGLAFVDI